MSARILVGDARGWLGTLPDRSIDLIVTSPPYADARKRDVAIHPDRYVEWFLPISAELQRVLKPDGTFILNIKEKVANGERHTYVIELILALRKQGWLWTEEYIWHKKNCYPGKWPNRFRDAWERCLQFNVGRKFYMDQRAVTRPAKESTVKRGQQNGPNDAIRLESATGTNFGKNVKKSSGNAMVLPSNVLDLPTEARNVGHNAAFPLVLPEFFIKLFSREGAVVLDPFMGSGTTLLAAEKLKRDSIGIELSADYAALAVKRIEAWGGLLTTLTVTEGP